jgi:hypothetical protein
MKRARLDDGGKDVFPIRPDESIGRVKDGAYTYITLTSIVRRTLFWVVILQLYSDRIYVLILLSKTVKAHPGFRDRVVGMISSHLSD